MLGSKQLNYAFLRTYWRFMKVVVVADTHMPAPGHKLPPELLEHMKDADCILHAGDFVEKSTLDELASYGDVCAVYGNMDSSELVNLLPMKRIENFGGVRVGMIHGFGPPKGLKNRVLSKFSEEDKLDVLVFGHSHTPYEERQQHLLIFNPGSPTDRTSAPFRSFGVFHIDDGKVKTELIRCSD